jgi:hypothetical protein
MMAGMDGATRAEIAQLRDAGWTQAAIAAELGLSTSSVWRACQPDAGRPRRRVEPVPEPKPAGLPVVLVLASVAVIGGVWLWGWWRRRAQAVEPAEPTDQPSDEPTEPSWPASA